MRVTFLIDGFNLYHSLRDAQYDLGNKSTKWLDIKSLCSSYLYLLGREANLQDIYYFSALATQRIARDPDVIVRHEKFISCLKNEGIEIDLSPFKPKENKCPSCSHTYRKYEEKETDVKLALKLLELFIEDSCDLVVLVSGDTDLAPSFRTATRLFPSKKVIFAFPYKRHNRELENLAPKSFKIKKEKYLAHQFPNPYPLVNGSTISKPSTW